jgi:hypothetical protein
MPKGILEFNLPEERGEYEDAQKGTNYKLQIDDIWNNVFRPAYKHGYSDQELQKLASTKVGQKLIDKLVNIYRQCINDEL